MRVLLWIGNEPNQKALSNKLAKEFNVVGIVTETRNSVRKITVKKIIHSLFEKVFLSSINKAWNGMRDFYHKAYKDYPKVDLIDVENINSEDAYNFTKSKIPDIIIVSGTRFVKSKMLSIKTKYGILNLHTGLSPYIKGGPNCTNWCIATNQFHLVGNTIMWIDEGIDSGNIVTTEQTDIDWKKSLLDIHIDVMEHAHELYIKAIEFIRKGGVSNVPQSKIAEGKTYYTKEWVLKNKIDLVRNLKMVKKQGLKNLDNIKVKTIKI